MKHSEYVKKPFFFGMIIFLITAIGWIVSIVFNVLTLGKFREVSNASGIIGTGALSVMSVTLRLGLFDG